MLPLQITWRQSIDGLVELACLPRWATLAAFLHLPSVSPSTKRDTNPGFINFKMHVSCKCLTF